MKYISTRGGLEQNNFSDVLLMGLAPDGGLTLPMAYPKFNQDELANMRNMSYVDLAYEVLSKYVLDDLINEEELKNMLYKIYNSAVFESDEVTPSFKILDEIYVLDLSCGPSRAFKDIALQFLGVMMDHVLGKKAEKLNILGASSGDTVSAAQEAVKGKENINIFMMTPKIGMSEFQKSQAGIISAKYSNVHNISVPGVFDDCQDLVKEVLNDKKFKSEFNIGAVNSINWARIAAQIVYSFKGYFAITTSNDEKVDISVPSGNFGDALSVYIAKQMGLPIRNIIIATNENKVLDTFLKTGLYKQTSSQITSSPSMDISKASNIERLFFDGVGRDANKLRDIMDKFASRKEVDLSNSECFEYIKNQGFVSGTSNHQDRLDMIKKIEQDSGEVIDPHTADGIKVGIEKKEDGVKMICFSTAKPIKFEPTIKEALGFVPKRPEHLIGLENHPQKFVDLPVDAEKIKQYIIDNI